MIDRIKQVELRNMYNPNGSPLRLAQTMMLDLLKFLDRICKQHNLNYWLDSGTLLGAVRHGGFIPWDDDVDVCMPRKDAQKLKSIMSNKVFDGHIVLQNQTTDWNYVNSGWMTLRDLNTEYIKDDNIHKALKYKGFQIDIFEMESGVAPWMKKTVNVIINKLAMDLTRRTSSTLLRNIANLNIRIINKTIIPFFRCINKINHKNSGNMISYALGNPFNKKHLLTTVYPLREIIFEDYAFSCPNNSEVYLETLYRDWKNIPDTNNIKTHNASFRFL